jgi:D-alanyl-D-alanine carboxypeptidase
VRPASPPNYELRRLVALTVLFVLAYSVFRIGGAVGSVLRSPKVEAAPSSRPGTVSSPPSPATSPGLVVPPDCTKGSDPTEAARPADWARTLLDTRFRLPSSYVPPNLVSVAGAGFQNPGGLLIRSIVIDDLRALRQAAAAAGNPLGIVAAYRSFDQQASLFSRRKKDLGLDQAERKTARAGHSEHQLGTAIDFKTLGEADVNSRWDSTPTGRWVLDNAWQFGFIQSYPQGKTAVTCYAYEPWHYRYFGRAVALAIHQSGLTVREYLWNESHGASP